MMAALSLGSSRTPPGVSRIAPAPPAAVLARAIDASQTDRIPEGGGGARPADWAKLAPATATRAAATPSNVKPRGKAASSGLRHQTPSGPEMPPVSDAARQAQ